MQLSVREKFPKVQYYRNGNFYRRARKSGGEDQERQAGAEAGRQGGREKKKEPK